MIPQTTTEDLEVALAELEPRAFEFYADHKEAWVTSHSVTTRAEAARLNEIIGRTFYREVA